MMLESGTIHLVLGYTDMRKSIDALSTRLSRIKDIVTTQVPHHEKPKRRLRRGLPFAVEREECKALADRH